jgi:hypothetical protein
MKKQELKSLKLNKNLISHLVQETINGGTNWPPRNTPTDSCFGGCNPTGQTGFWCLTGFQTNCQ